MVYDKRTATTDKKSLENLRDCVKQAFFNGCEGGDEFRKMRHGIVSELKRTGHTSSDVKDALLDWNERCERPLGVSDQKRQLLAYVDWFNKKGWKIGCKGLKDYCLGEGNCEFYKRVTYQKKQETKDLPFNIQELDKFINERFNGTDAYVMLLTVRALRYVQVEKATGEVIIIGVRGLTSIIRDRNNQMMHHQDIFKRLQLLIDEGVIEKVVKGKPGNFSRQANGYKFRAWRPP